MRRVIFVIFRCVNQLFSGTGLRVRMPMINWCYQLLLRWLRPGVVQARVQGHRLFVDPKDHVIAPRLLLLGIWEPFETEIFQKNVESGMVVVILGAHIGYYALLAARKVGDTGRVYAFEPSPDSFQLLVRNIEANGYRNIEPIRKAVSNFNGKTKLYLHSFDTGDHRIYPTGEARQCIDVEAVRLDDWMVGREERVDVIEMDIQGAEIAALEGMDGLVRRSRRLKIFTEIWPEGLTAAGGSVEQYLQRLTGLGFNVQVVNEERKTLDLMTRPEELDRYHAVLRHKNLGLNLLCVKEA